MQEQCNELEAKISPHKSQTQLPQWGDAPVHGHSRVQLSWRDWDGDDHAQDKSVASALEPSEAAVANKQTRGPETRGPPQTRCPSSPGEMVPNTSAAACASTPAPTAAQQSATREWFDAVQGDDESFTSIDFEDEHNSCRHERKKETTVVDARTEEGGRGRMIESPLPFMRRRVQAATCPLRSTQGHHTRAQQWHADRLARASCKDG